LAEYEGDDEMFSVSPSQKVFEPELDVIDNTGGVITVIITVDDTGEVEEQLELASDTRYSPALLVV
jgi:hypothetical protein